MHYTISISVRRSVDENRIVADARKQPGHTEWEADAWCQWPRSKAIARAGCRSETRHPLNVEQIGAENISPAFFHLPLRIQSVCKHSDGECRCSNDWTHCCGCFKGVMNMRCGKQNKLIVHHKMCFHYTFFCKMKVIFMSIRPNCHLQM